MPALPNRFLFFPDPPQRGHLLGVCEDFTLAPPITGERVVEIQMTPDDGSVSVKLSPTKTCATVYVPDSAVGVTAHDTTGQSQDYTRPTV